MRRLGVFTQLSLDGFFADARGDMSWAHKHDAEWRAFMAENAGGGGALVFGRVTYALMADYWPTAAAYAANPAVADRMTRMPKVVFSRTLGDATWQNTTVLAGDPAAEMRRLKAEPGPDMVILGSGSLVAQLTAAALVDEYVIAVNPVALGTGRSLFQGIPTPVPLTLTRTRGFRNGNVVSWYEPGPAAGGTA